MPQLPLALRAFAAELSLVLEEVSLRKPAPQAKRDVVPEGLSSLFLYPVALRLRHLVTHLPWAKRRGPKPDFGAGQSPSSVSC
jgi:hypothetical protein